MNSRKNKSKRAASAQVYSAPALEKGIEIVELLADAPEGLSISEIATRLGRSMNEVFRIIVVMERQSWLRKDPETDRYNATYHVLELAFRATPAQALSAIAAPIMNHLSTLTHQSCHLVVRAAGRGLVVHRQESVGGHASFAVRLGVAVDLQASCSGHVLLAFSTADALASALKEMPRPHSVSSTKLATILARVRQRGYETQPSARTVGVTDLSFPIFGFDGRIAAALTVPYLVFIDNSAPTTLARTRQLLRDAARRVSRGLGWYESKSVS
jgi:DNA-binding IclR family transcriptional regulator